MKEQYRNRRAVWVAGILFLLMFCCMTVNAEAAWKKNTNGTYSYYSKGKLVKNKWIGEDYYVNSKGIRQTGWLKLKKKWYYFSSSGKLVKKKWIKSDGKLYYAGADGALYTSGIYKIGDYYYGFDSRGAQLRGKTLLKGEYYFFGLLKGQMQVKKWIKTDNVYYYYCEDGVMARNKWVGRYYFNSKGIRLTNTWKGKRYLGSDGKAVSGLKKIGSYYYYFDPKTYKKVTNTTVTVQGVAYEFDSAGRGTSSIETDELVEASYYTDPNVDDETLLAAIIYCEAGNQAYTGQAAVGVVIMNRVKSSLFPSQMKEVVYQKTQFTPARDGSLTRALTNPLIVTESCRQAAAEVMAKYEGYIPGQKVYLQLKNKTIAFPYLFFMTQPAYTRLGLTAKTRKIGDHVFFKLWK